jgi:hypothetical protein
MRALGWFLVSGVVMSVVAVAPGCRDATQVTLDVRAVNASCGELRGTSVTVGVEPGDTEQRVGLGYVNASTSACSADGEIGTLVVTPSDPKRAAVVVVVAYGSTSDPTKCTPPAYKGCIVARRSFAFVDHEGLRLPITISPDCLDVPCDAFSTCRNGQCFSSEVSCSGGVCGEPGALEDGGTAPDSGIAPPPPPPGAPIEPVCDGATLHCHPSGDPNGDMACSGTSLACCDRGGLAVCGASATCASNPRYCCADSDCPSGVCVRANRTLNIPDAATPDAGTDPDAGGFGDAGGPGDSGGPVDSGIPDASVPDASLPDGGGIGDAGPLVDGGGTLPGTGIGVCQP